MNDKQEASRSELSEATLEMLEGYDKAGLLSKKEKNWLADKRIEALALERIKTWDESKAISHEELKARLGISD